MLKRGKDFVLYGNYARKLLSLSEKKELFEHNDVKNQLFQRNLDVFLTAPIIGLRENCFIEENEKDSKFSEIKCTINYTQLAHEEEKINYIGKLLMLYSDILDLTMEDRIEKIFKVADEETTKIMRHLYIGYLKGGIDLLYENLIDSSENLIDSFLKVYDYFDYLNINKINKEVDYTESPAKLLPEDIIKEVLQ